LANALTDSEFVEALKAQQALGRSYLLVLANKFSVSVLASSSGSESEWVEVGRGDLANEMARQLELAGKQGRLLWSDVTDPATAVPLGATLLKVGGAHVKAWQRERDKVTGFAGRTCEADAKTRFEVASRAAWRCQFEGCGEDLRRHFLPGTSGNFGYFAHIVAASSDGPRGDNLNSARLANEADNIMLLCDKCHRLIDRVEPECYGVELLNEMRERNVAEVRRLLSTLQYPVAQMLVVGGNIEGQSFAFDARIAEEAMWARGIRSGPDRPEWFVRHGAHLGSPHSPGYWSSLFPLLKNTDLPRLRGMLTGTSHGGAPRPPLAVFPLHSTSVLVLAGRLVGESSTVHLFQFHRDQVSGQRGGQWAWPNVAKPASDKFKVVEHRTALAGETEAVLLLNLTASVPPSDLPSELYRAGSFVLPAIEVTVGDCSHRVISHVEDLELFGRSVDIAIRKIQDEWRVRKIHVVAIAPATACFRFGQKMQARHHANYILYERRPGAKHSAPGPFESTIQISSTEVTLLSTGESTSIS
jgi:hypothetical protein